MDRNIPSKNRLHFGSERDALRMLLNLVALGKVTVDEALTHFEDDSNAVETGCSACAKHEKDMEQELEARDGNAAYADQLTAMIGVYFETDHGEHSNLNDPWENAIETMRVAIGTKPEHQKTSPEPGNAP